MNNKMKMITAAVLALLMAALCLTACGGGEKITVTVVDGSTRTEVQVSSGAKVSEALAEAGVKLGDKDTCSPAADTALTAAATVTVTRYTEGEVKEEVVTEKIAYTTKEVYSDDIAEGEKVVTQKGVDGEKEITYKVTYVDGKETARELVSEKIVKDPVEEIITIGTGSDDDGYDGNEESGRTEISRVPYYDCDGSGHGYYEITYDDGSVEYEVF